jgi:hypothetical protein
MTDVRLHRSLFVQEPCKLKAKTLPFFITRGRDGYAAPPSRWLPFGSVICITPAGFIAKHSGLCATDLSWSLSQSHSNYFRVDPFKNGTGVISASYPPL